MVVFLCTPLLVKHKRQCCYSSRCASLSGGSCGSLFWAPWLSSCSGQGLFPLHLSGQSKIWAGQSKAELLFWILSWSKELSIPQLLPSHSPAWNTTNAKLERGNWGMAGLQALCLDICRHFISNDSESRYCGAFRDLDLGILFTVTQDGTEVRSSKLKAFGLKYRSNLKFWGTRKKFSVWSPKSITFSNAY